ncbi:MAG: GNAT family N-acetyltransferase [Chloroflexota bacterium]
MSIHLRPGTVDDREHIIDFDQIAQSDPQRVDFIQRVIDSELCLVAERDSLVIAYGVLEYTFFDNGFISMIYVASTARRLGVGRLLVNALVERCVTPKLFTSTNQSNVPMQRLLENLGFIQSGIIYNLDPGDPELIYFMDRQVEA